MHPEGTEVDPEAWWAALLEAFADAGGLDGVGAIAIAGQQHGMVVLDARGRVIRDALLWNDTRSAPAAADLIADVGAAEYAARTGAVPVASFTATKLRWLRDAEPENAARVAAVALPHDWLTWRLLGYGPQGSSPRGPVLDALTTDRSDASGTSYWSPASASYDLDLFERALGRPAREATGPHPAAAQASAEAAAARAAAAAAAATSATGPFVDDPSLLAFDLEPALGLELGHDLADSSPAGSAADPAAGSPGPDAAPSATGPGTPDATGLPVTAPADPDRTLVILPRVIAAGDAAGTTVSLTAAAPAASTEIPDATPGAAPVAVPAGIVVGAGAGDNAGAALGLDASSGDMVISIGTSGTAFAVTDHPVADTSGTVAGFADAAGAYLPLVATLNAARVLTSISTLLGVDYDEFARLALAAEPGSGGVVLVPYFEGERTPNLPDSTATLAGLTIASSTRENLARAAIEGMLCALADGLGAIRSLGVDARRVLLIGGAAQNPAVQTVASQVFDVPVSIPTPGEYVADGAARQAAWTLLGSRPTWPLSFSAELPLSTIPAITAHYTAAQTLGSLPRP